MSADADYSSSSLGFKQLDDANYSIWLPRMTDALKKKKYWRYANGTENKPELDRTITYAGDATGRATQTKAMKAFNEELKEWEDNDDAAAALIRSGVGDSQLHHLTTCTSADETWTAIRTAHEKQGLNHALSYLHLLWSTRLAEGGKVQEHITALRTAHDRLIAADVGMDFSDQALAGMLMFSFPSSYEPIKMTLSTLKRDDFTFAAVRRAMLNEEQRRLTSASLPPPVGGISEQSALAVHRSGQHQQQQQQQQQQQPDTSTLAPCNWCGLDNHLEVNCHRKRNGIPQRTVAERQEALKHFREGRKRGYRGRGGNSSPPKQANVAALQDDGGNAYFALPSGDLEGIESDATEPSAVSVACLTASNHSAHAHTVSLHSKGLPKSQSATDWYVDSGASYHYCRHRDWFDEFTPVQQQSVNMGDGGRIPLLARGSIRAHVPISVDQTEAGTFRNVRYAPDLTVNLLSVAAMTENGLSVHFDGRVCTIRNREKKIIGRAVQVTNRLYRLSLTKTVTISNSTRADSGSSTTPSPRALNTTVTVDFATKKTAKPDSALTRELLSLFHHRLGHASYDSVRKLFAKHMGTDTRVLSVRFPVIACIVSRDFPANIVATRSPTSSSRSECMRS